MNIPNTKTPLLDQVDLPEDLRKLEKWQLRQFADELRTDLIDIVSVTGGHFGAGLGVVELTTALHYVFKTPDDRIIWDVGHQAYPHKILTGRRSRMRTPPESRTETVDDDRCAEIHGVAVPTNQSDIRIHYGL